MMENKSGTALPVDFGYWPGRIVSGRGAVARLGEVVGEVGLLPNGAGGFNLAVTLYVEIAGLDQAKAEEIVRAAHAVCPYSNAIHGNVDVKINVSTRG